ncbi:hypothetical protein EZS27_007399 [termite gut metagenome]|uniref:Glycosyl-hydrolase family 116 catalytic region domain-containing protein n=1 Tax=termite gut metagenome TaxID=433724 RepID=A0A5J4SFS4_9ZZZZ
MQGLFSPGLDIRPLHHPLGFEYGDECFGPLTELRTLDSIRKSLLNPDSWKNHNRKITIEKMKNKRKKEIVFIAMLSLCMFQGYCQQLVDYRYAPQWWQSCVGLPDDSCKTLVGPLGQLLYESGGKWMYKNVSGFHSVVHFLADENMKINSQRMYSARVPIVITESTYSGMDITQEVFAVGLDFTRNKVATTKGNREDIVLTTISNHTNRAQTINPLLIIDSDHPTPVKVNGRIAVINDKAQVISSEATKRVRQSMGDFKTLMELEPVRLGPGEKKQIIILYDNGLPSDLALQFKDNPTTLVSRIRSIKAEMVDYWENKSGIPYDHLIVPDKEMQNLTDASLRGIWQAREIKNRQIVFQVGPTCYRGLWVVDGAFLLEAAAMFDRGLEARDGIEYTLSLQKENGQFDVIPTFSKENGIVLWTCVRHALLMQDKKWLKNKWSQLKKTVAFIKELRAMTLTNDIPLDDGLIPPGYIDGGLNGGKDVAEYTNIYWNLAGLKAMIQAAHWLGEKKDAKEWEKEYADFYAIFQKAAQRDKMTDTFGNQYLPVPMDPKYHSLPQRAQWAFCQGVYPGQIFDKEDPIAMGTMNMLHTTLQEGMVMGTGWEISGIWNYFAGFYGHACLWVGDSKRAYESLYAFANHASPLYAWREEQSPRDLDPHKYVGDMPHNWASAEFVGLTIHLLALDRGDEMHLLEGLPQEWIQPGMKTALKDISTPFGKVSFTLQVDKSGKTATLTTAKLTDPSCKGMFVHLGDWGESNGSNVIKLDAKKTHTVNIHLK